MDIDDVDVSLITAAAARGCDRCGGSFEGGRVIIRGEDVIEIVCASCLAGAGEGRTLH